MWGCHSRGAGRVGRRLCLGQGSSVFELETSYVGVKEARSRGESPGGKNQRQEEVLGDQGLMGHPVSGSRRSAENMVKDGAACRPRLAVQFSAAAASFPFFFFFVFFLFFFCLFFLGHICSIWRFPG